MCADGRARSSHSLTHLEVQAPRALPAAAVQADKVPARTCTQGMAGWLRLAGMPALPGAGCGGGGGSLQPAMAACICMCVHACKGNQCWRDVRPAHEHDMDTI